MIRLRALKAQREFWELERKRDENRKTTERMKEEIRKMDQAIASSSKFIKELKGADTQYIAMGQAIADFWDTSDVPQDPIASNIPSYPSLESLDEEPKEELTEALYGYYRFKREIIMEKLAVAYEIYCTHLKETDPKKRSMKYLLQYNDISNRLHGQFEVVASMLALPVEEFLFAYPTLDYLMEMVEQKDLNKRGRNCFQELMREIEIKNAIAEKILQNRYTIVVNSSEKAEAEKQHKNYQKESKRLMDFCRKMIDKKDKEAGCIDLEQPQGIPDVKPISKTELDEKIAEAIIKPKKAQAIGENTIPPHYSREISRYEPPLQVKKREQEEALENVREMTNGGSKGSKSEKQAEGETELSWDHEGLEPYPGPGKPNSQRNSRESKPPEKEVDKRISPKICPKCKGNHDEKDCTEPPPKEVEKKLQPPKDSRGVPERDKEDLGPKLGGESVIDKDTKQWVDEQNKFWEEEKKRREREEQKESIPRKFKPKASVKVLQRGKQSVTAIPSQTPKRPRDDRYTQGQNYSWYNSYVEPEYWGGYRTGYSYGQGIVMEIKVGDKEMVMVRSMVLGIRKDKEGLMEYQVLKAILIAQPMKAGELLNIHHQGLLVVARKVMMEMGVIRVMVTRKSINVPNMILRIWMRRRVIQKIHLN